MRRGCGLRADAIRSLDNLGASLWSSHSHLYFTSSTSAVFLFNVFLIPQFLIQLNYMFLTARVM